MSLPPQADPSVVAVPSTLSCEEASSLINEIRDLAFTNWSEPDWEGVRVILAFLGAYFLHEPYPFWVHVVGPPSTGKTSLGFAPIHKLGSYAFSLGDITGSTLLSGYGKGKERAKSYSLLHRMGKQGILYSTDFSKVLAKPFKVVDDIAGTLRDVYDGHAEKNVGMAGRTIEWLGRISMITATTPDKLHNWIAINKGGERFLSLFWRGSTNHMEIAERILQYQEWESQQIWDPEKIEEAEAMGPGGQIRERVRRLVEGLEGGVKPRPPGREAVRNLAKLARIVALTRSMPTRPDGKHISKAENTEDPGRVQHQLVKVARGLAHMKRLERPGPEEMRLTRRVAMDSIPSERLSILSPFPLNGDEIQIQDILLESGYQTYEAIEWELANLLALGIACPVGFVAGDAGMFWRETSWSLSDSFQSMLEGTFIDAGEVDRFGDLTRYTSDGTRPPPPRTTKLIRRKSKPKQDLEVNESESLKALDSIIH